MALPISTSFRFTFTRPARPIQFIISVLPTKHSSVLADHDEFFELPQFGEAGRLFRDPITAAQDHVLEKQLIQYLNRRLPAGNILTCLELKKEFPEVECCEDCHCIPRQKMTHLSLVTSNLRRTHDHAWPCRNMLQALVEKDTTDKDWRIVANDLKCRY